MLALDVRGVSQAMQLYNQLWLAMLILSFQLHSALCVVSMRIAGFNQELIFGL